MKIKLFLLFTIISINCFGGELTRGASILEVANHATGNGQNFAVKIEGGSGICTGWIYFFENTAASQSSYNQAFSIALAALASGKPVRIHNFSDDSCTGAQFISISK